MLRVFFHLEELHSFTKGVRNLLSEDGVYSPVSLYEINNGKYSI